MAFTHLSLQSNSLHNTELVGVLPVVGEQEGQCRVPSSAYVVFWEKKPKQTKKLKTVFWSSFNLGSLLKYQNFHLKTDEEREFTFLRRRGDSEDVLKLGS